MSVHDGPSVAELLAAVRGYLTEEVAAAASDRRAKFRALIAANVLHIAERELACAPEHERAEEADLCALGLRDGSCGERRRALARAIRAGAYDEGERSAAAFAYARAAVRRKLAVANPRFLERAAREA